MNTVRLNGAVATAGTVLVVARTPAPPIYGLALLGIGVAVVLPLSFTAAGTAATDPSRTIAGVATIAYTSHLLPPAVMGFISDATTALPGSFALMAVLTLFLPLTASVPRSSGTPAKAVPSPEADCPHETVATPKPPPPGDLAVGANWRQHT
ncbi:hypothetical protein [Streptomyces sp. NPDC091209]|uniref:hypothetical protein n=1 Tax=Streptomyces sp. NPDC091209 TaxID=3365974 RepID=UPI0038053D8B